MLYGAQAVFDAYMAADFCKAINDWIAAEWLSRTGAGAWVDYATPASWVQVLKTFIDSLERYVAPSTEPFLRRNLTRRLAQILDEVKK